MVSYGTLGWEAGIWWKANVLHVAIVKGLQSRACRKVHKEISPGGELL